MARLFTVASDETLCAMIRTARERLVLVAPGLSRTVAATVAERIRLDGGPGAIAVILDVDPEVCRLGYGEIEAIDLLRPALALRNSDIQMQKGVRIGLAIADDEVLVYSPTPMLLEAGSNSEEKPNAIRLSNTSSPDLAAACGASEATVSAPRPEIGLSAASQKVVEETKADLKENPPRQFNLVRLERVFNYKLEFVEFSLSEFRLNKRTVSLPADLLGLVEKDLRDRLHNTFRIFEGGVPFEFELSDPRNPKETLKISEKWIGKEADRLRKEYFIPLGASSYGNLILKRRKAEFQREVSRLKALVAIYAGNVCALISEKVYATRDDLIKALFPRIKAAPPGNWIQRSVDGRLGEEALMQRLQEAVDQAFTNVDQDYQPTLTCLFKGVNYETITADKHFRERIEEYFGRDEASHLLSEYDASRAEQQTFPL